VRCPPPHPLHRLHRRWRRQGAPRPDAGRRALLERSGTPGVPAQGIPGIQGTRSSAVPRDRGGGHEVQPRRDGEEVCGGAGGGGGEGNIGNIIIYSRTQYRQKIKPNT